MDLPAYKDGVRGMNCYIDGAYKDAAPLLKCALDAGHHYFASIYADICHRDLDDRGHAPIEAATWYIRGAAFGDGDTMSYLASLSEDVIDESLDESVRVRKLVDLWTQPI